MATQGTAEFLQKRGLEVKIINKVRDGSPHVVDGLLSGSIDMVINTPEGTGPLLDSRSIRSTATELSLPLFTTVAAAENAVQGIELLKQAEQMYVRPIQEYLALAQGKLI